MSHVKFPSELWSHLSAMSPGRTYGDFFASAANPETTSGRLGQIIDANPASLHLIQQVEAFKARRKKWEAANEPAKSTDGKPVKPMTVGGEALVTTLGKFALRDILACIRFHRMADVGMPRKISDQFNPAIRDIMKSALTAEAFCEDRRMANPEFAYAAGLLYDGLLFRVGAIRGAPKDVKAQAEAALKEGMLTAQLAYGIASHMGQLKLSPYAFGAGLMLSYGKAWMSWFYQQPAPPSPSWKEFQAECDGYGIYRRVALTILEKKRFPVSHAELSALFANASGALAPVESAIAGYLEPELLRKAAPASYALARVLKAASILASTGVSGGWEGVKARATAIELAYIKSLKIPDEAFLRIMKKAKG